MSNEDIPNFVPTIRANVVFPEPGLPIRIMLPFQITTQSINVSAKEAKSAS